MGDGWGNGRELPNNGRGGGGGGREWGKCKLGLVAVHTDTAFLLNNIQSGCA